MPWHDDDHKFGESEAEMTWDNVAKKFIPIFEEIEEDWKRLTPSPIDKHLRGIPFPATSLATVCLVDNGKCYYCQDRAIYAYRSRLYCATCWLELNEEDDD